MNVRVENNLIQQLCVHRKHFFSRVLWCTTLLTLCWFLGHPGSVRAESLTLDDMVVDNSNGTITVHCGVVVHDDAPLTLALAQGVQLRFTGTVSLYKKRSLWWDQLLAENSLFWDLRQDILTQEGVMWSGGEEIRFPFAEFSEHLHDHLHHLVIPVASWSLIQRGGVYRVCLHLTLSRKDIPVWIRIPLFFWSWDLLPDKTFEMEFSY